MIVYCQSQMMISPTLFVNSITMNSASHSRSVRFKFKIRSFLKPLHSNSNDLSQKPSVLQDSLRVLEWDKVCDSVASFAGTSLGREATKAQLWLLNQSYEESMNLLAETNAAVEMLKYGGCGMDFNGVNVALAQLWLLNQSYEESMNLLAETNAAVEMLKYGGCGMDFNGVIVALVKSAIKHASRGMPMDGNEALSVATLLQFSEALQFNLKVAFKEDSDWYNRFMPLTKMIMELVINQSLVKSILQVIDEDGSVKDSASTNLKRSRDQVRMLEKKLYQLMDGLIRNEQNESSSLEVSNINGRWCLKSGVDQLTNVNGLLLSSGSDLGSLVEPLSAIPLNDELQQARSLVAKAEEDVLLRLTEKMQRDLDDIHNSLNTIIELDMVTARAKYSLFFGGTLPDLFFTDDKDEYFTAELHPSGSKIFKDASSHSTQREWTLYLPKAYHPLLLQQHRQNLQKARKDVSNAIAEIRRRRLYRENKSLKENPAEHLASMEMKVSKLEEAHPVPVDFFVGKRTRVLVITGPNTGGKTICLKTVGLAAMMAKSGLYVLSSEPVRIPWFDSVFADIGDEQSLSQSLSTFSGHLRRISAIQAQSTNKSLVLLDEVGAGTNPLEGAALGMSLLESFAEAGAFLTIATTHHGELKTLKYSDDAFENACMEFDEVNLKPTYKILWGIPGRSNAINIAERLGLPNIILDNARELYGTASAEIDRVIFDLEQFKQEIHDHTHEAQQYLSLSKELHENLLVAKQKITEHGTAQRYKKMNEISEAASVVRSVIHKKLQEFRASATQPPQSTPVTKSQHATGDDKQHTSAENIKHPRSDNSSYSVEGVKQLRTEKQIQLPKVGGVVHVSSLGKKANVLKVDASKQEIIVQANNMKLRLKLSDIET